MEELLNKLIEKGRVPFGDEKIHSFEIIYVTWKIRNIIAKRWRWQINKHYSIRDICSKSSWLWKFVCENKLYNSNNRWYWGKNVTIVWEYPTLDWDENIWYREYQYYLIESALCDEDNLEQFLLNNIKIDEI
jgi:hypothetical protein